MFLLLKRSLNPSLYYLRSYVTSAGDEFSVQRAEEFERSLWCTSATAMAASNVEGGVEVEEEGEARKGYEIYTVPRARMIHQSLLTTPISALKCCFACVHVLRGNSNKPSLHPQYPDLIICNGPGTAVCVVFMSLLLKYFGIPGVKGKMRTIYVESFARVRTLSLSGRILWGCCDRFVVQWEGLKGGRAEYLGVLV
jgi:beta-1,4-N-acetylglucosaminyltransferase